MSSILFAGCLVISLIVSLRWYYRAREHPSPESWMAFLVPPALVTMGALLYYRIYSSIFEDWNWIHLQPSFVWAKGLGVYHGAESGPVLNAIYGPVSVLAFAPAVWASSPESAMIIAEVLAMAFFFLPVLIALWAGAGERGRLLFAFFAFLCFSFIPFISSPLRSAAFNVHADAPCLGIGALACVALYIRRRHDDWLLLSVSAFLAVLAVWTKQVIFPLLLALALYVLIVDGRGVFFRYVLCLMVTGMLVSLILIWQFGREELLLNLVTIPARHPWREEGFLPAVLKLGRELLIVSPFVLLSLSLHLSREERGRKFAEWARSKPWSLFIMVSLFMIPVSVMGKTKVGGSNNVLSYTLYYLVIAAIIALVSPRTGRLLSRAKRLAIAIMAVFLLILIPGVFYRFAYAQHPPNYARVAYEFAKRHPAEGYFPRLTLLSLMAEGELYHDSTGLRDRQWAGLKIRKEHFDAHIPARMRLIAFRDGANDEMDCMQMSTYNQPAIRDPELPGFLVYTEGS